mgnify:FL=1
MGSKKIFLVFLVAVLIFPSLLVAASPVEVAEDEDSDTAELEEGSFSHKDEVIYGTLQSNGDQDEIYVVNHFRVTEPGMLIDHGNYDSIRNLTDLSEIEQMNDEIHFAATEENFYYQGNMNHEALPWEFSISYFLDGEEKKPAELLGANGHIEIVIETAQNEEGEQLFFENYLLQISLTADPDRYSNIEAEEAAEASAGTDKQFTYTVMPEEEEVIRFSADVTDFELEAIDITAVPSTMSIDEPDTDEMTEEMTSLTDAIGEINHGVGELRDGVSELNSGVTDLQDGSGQFRDGMTEINQSSSELIEGSSQINDALATMSHSLSEEDIDFDLGELTRLPEGLDEMAGAVGEIADGLEELQENYQTAYDVFDKAMEEIPDYHIDEEEIHELYRDAGGESEALDQLVGIYEKALAAKGTYNEVKQGFQAIDPALTEVISGIRELETALNTTSKEISTAINNMDVMDPITQLSEGLTEISNNYNAFHAGLKSYTDGVDELSGVYRDIHAGISELGEGTRHLEEGASEFHDGTNELYASTNDLPDQMQEEIDEMIAEYDKSDFDPVSFTSSENENINSVQFVLRTENITADDDEDDNDKAAEEEEKSIWERFLDLFR